MLYEILTNVISAVIAGGIIYWIGWGRTSHRIEIVQKRRVGWFWKLITPGGKFLFFYGILVFASNYAVKGLESSNTGLGLSLMTLGIILWAVGNIVIHFQRD